MRVLLIFPPADIEAHNIRNVCPPLGIAYLGAVLEQSGHDVSLLDCQTEGFDQVRKLGNGRIRFGLSREKIGQRLRDFSPEVVGISCLFSQMSDQAKDVARIAKQVNPDTVTILGGFHPTLFPEDGLAEPAVDIVFRGQGEQSLPLLLDKLAGGGDILDIPGVTVRDDKAEKGYRGGQQAPFIKDLNSIPFPARHLLPMEAAFLINFPHGGHVKKQRVTQMLTSRGCPHSCGFCNAASFWQKRIAFRSPENVVAEMEHLVDKYKVEEIHFEDENLIADRSRALALFRLMKKLRLPLVWNVPYGIAPGSLDEELLEAMVESGCYEIALAVESGDEQILTKTVGKPQFLDKLPGIVQICRRLGIFVYGFLLVGFPDETAEQVRRTLRAPWKYGFMDAYVSIWVPLPQTRLYDYAVEKGIILPEDVTFANMHMKARIPRQKGISLPTLERMVARATWHYRLSRLLHPKIFIQRYLRPLIKSPGFGFRYVFKSLAMALRPSRVDSR